ncbi:MAG: PQQ-dependent sugar dehydrogenase [Gammaproteobacteria bacterium]
MPRPGQAALPPGFADAFVADIDQPTAIAFTPDGRMLITSQPGRLHVYQNNGLTGSPATDLSLDNRVCSNSERGLLGVAVDPGFATNHYIYVFYTFNKSGICPLEMPQSSDNPVNRVSRFTLSNTNIINLASERILIDNIPSAKGSHNAGDLHFGKDGYLYVSVGDGGCDYALDSGCGGQNDATRDMHVLLGKILRITRDGAIPPSNPFVGADSARCAQTGRTVQGKHCQETYARGLRNPFRFAFDPNSSATRFFINDVGQNTWEEIDEGRAGADYGWNVREGFCQRGSVTCSRTPAQFTNPIYAYGRNTGCSAVTGAAFVPNGHWPAQYNGNYLYSDYTCGKIFRLLPQADGSYKSQEFATGLGSSSAVSMVFGPYNGGRALFYTTYANGGQIRRISFGGSGNLTPAAVASASPRYGALPLNVSFDGSQSSDPDGDALTFAWNFGDGSPPAFGRNVSHTYSAEGAYFATLTVNDGRGGEAQASVRIDAGHTPPRVTVLSPSADARFKVGQSLTLRASAVDESNRTLPGSALRWTVLLHHGAHTHPYFGPQAGNGIVVTAPAPEDLVAARTSYLEVRLVAKDARGLETAVVHNVLPRLVKVNFASVPTNLRLKINGQGVTAPKSYTSWDGYRINVVAPNQTDASGRRYVFRSWSDGGAQSHVITTPSAPGTFTATFR